MMQQLHPQYQRLEEGGKKDRSNISLGRYCCECWRKRSKIHVQIKKNKKTKQQHRLKLESDSWKTPLFVMVEIKYIHALLSH